MEALQALSSDLAAAVERAAPAVVAVNARPRLPSSGVHWRPGVIVTADHAVQVDEDITITEPGGGRVPATLAGRDPSTDLAILRTTDASLPPAQLGDPGALKAGHIVLALGYGPRVSWGVVSALGGLGRARGPIEPDRLARLDLVLYPGFSGGPLVDAAGRVVGINTSGLSRTGPIAIPASAVTRIADLLLRAGRVARGYLGVGLQPVRLPENLKSKAGGSRETGLIVVSIEPGGPADRAGLLIGDVLLALDGASIRDIDDIHAVLGPDRVGSRASALIIRAGEPAEVAMTVGERPPRRR